MVVCVRRFGILAVRHKNKVNGKTQKMQHLTPKPKDMIERIIKASSNKGDLILDCFMDSGTTAIVSKKMDRDFIGTELNKDYYRFCIKQLKEI